MALSEDRFNQGVNKIVVIHFPEGGYAMQKNGQSHLLDKVALRRQGAYEQGNTWDQVPVISFDSKCIFDIDEQFHEDVVLIGYSELTFGEADVKR